MLVASCCISIFLSTISILPFWSSMITHHEFQSIVSAHRNNLDNVLDMNDEGDDDLLSNVYNLHLKSSSFMTSHDQSKNVHSSEENDSYQQKNQNLPGIAWLLSFPNSGTSFTMHLVGQGSKLSVATNYGKEYQLQFDEGFKKKPIPLSAESPNGPFLLSPEKQLPSSTSFIMTKTHCGGYCTTCSPSVYIETKHSFMSSCARGSYTDEYLNRQTVEYDFKSVKKAIHLFRDPFSNIVSNFHLDRNEHEKQNKVDWLKKFTNDANGFKRWCRYLDQKHSAEEKWSHFLPDFITQKFTSVPCHKLFYLFTEWHNLARQVTVHLDLPTLVIEYEDYENNFESTVSAIFEFLNLPLVEKPINFISGKKYVEYFSHEERLAAKILVQTLSDEWTWSIVSKYFP